MNEVNIYPEINQILFRHVQFIRVKFIILQSKITTILFPL